MANKSSMKAELDLLASGYADIDRFKKIYENDEKAKKNPGYQRISRLGSAEEVLEDFRASIDQSLTGKRKERNLSYLVDNARY